MAAKASSAYDDGVRYVVKLKRPVDYRRSRLLPLPEHQMTGRVLNAIVAQEGSDVIDRAEPR